MIYFLGFNYVGKSIKFIVYLVGFLFLVRIECYFFFLDKLLGGIKDIF